MADKPTYLSLKRSGSAQRTSWLVLAALLVSGCTGFGPWRAAQVSNDDYVGSEMSILSTHLDTMRALAEAEPGEQERIFDETRYAARATGTSSRRLRLALALAVPGHPSSNAGEAYEMLSELLASPEALLQSERRLARVQLAELRQRMILEAEVASLGERVKTLSRQPRRTVAAAPSPGLAERVTELTTENERLSTELEAARAKLEAVTAIESDADR